uniref:N-opsin1 n=1 Tax=Capitella teleta TaxID=283909 RepID=A0A2Z5D849_CAPTE|nr:n-opsin1 [Capitella teleta]
MEALTVATTADNDSIHQAVSHAPDNPVADLLIGIYVSVVGCVFEAFVVFFCGCNSIWILTMLSLYRYLKICHGPSMPKNDRPFVMTAAVLSCLMCAGWCISPFLGWGRYGPEIHGLTCSLDWEHQSPGYIYSIFTCIYLIPLILMIFSYAKIITTVRASRLRTGLQVNKSEYKLTRVALIMCSVFFVAWTPYAVVSLLTVLQQNHLVPTMVALTAPIFAKSNAFLNPVVYFLAMKQFRQETMQLMLCKTIQNQLDKLHHTKSGSEATDYDATNQDLLSPDQQMTSTL